MTDPAAKVAKLAALALHAATPIDEARTAALAALRLAARHGWALRPPPARPARRGGSAYDPADWGHGSANRDAYERTAREQEERRARAGRANEERAAGPNGGRPRRGAFQPCVLGWHRCATCGESIEPGSVAWQEHIDADDTRIWHADCGDPPMTAQQPNKRNPS